VGGLDGLWDVRRTGGALPPLLGVRKRIRGARGATLVAGRVGVPFDVRGLELHYRAPLAGVVDVLERDGDGFRGRATVLGRPLGEFEMRRIVVSDLTELLVRHLDEAHAIEQSVLRLLDGMLETADDPEIVDRLEHHKLETQRHAAAVRRRLEAHGAQPSVTRQAAGILEALAKLPLDLVRGERAGRNARELYATEHLEIAGYELLQRVAARAHDEETVQAVAEILAEERAMAAFVEERWDRFAELALLEEGVSV
jgi:ferritin-like metal-binding protein YciE